MRRAAKVDDNQSQIVRVLRAIGATVTPTHMIGQGFPDLCVGYRGKNYLLEIKDGDKVPSRQKLTPDEVDWHEAWRGQVAVVNNPKSAIEAVKG